MVRALILACTLVTLTLNAGPVARSVSAAPMTSCAAPAPGVPVPTAPHGLFASNVNLPAAGTGLPSSTTIAHYLLSDPTVCGADLVVPWSAVDRGPGRHPRFDWATIDRAAAPWFSAHRMVNLIVWGVAETVSQQFGQPVTPPYVLKQVHTVQCSSRLPATPVYWESAYRDNFHAFMRAVAAHYGHDSRIGYIRFGIGAGGEDYPANGLRGSCLARWRARGLSAQRWQSYSLGMIHFESTLHVRVQLMVGLNGLSGTPGAALPDAVAAAAASHGIGIGIQGLAAGTMQAVQAGRSCYANWCALFDRFAGRVPLEVQTFTRSNPAGAGPTGALPPLLSFALGLHAQIFELYPEEWLVADDPSFPGYAQAHAAYHTALTQAAAAVNTGSAASTPPAGGVRVERNVPYIPSGDGFHQGDVYLPSHPSRALRPAVVVIHGGGWAGGSKDDPDVVFLSQQLASRGYVAFNVNYRLDGADGAFPSDVQDVKDAVAFIAHTASTWHIDPKRLAVVGTSAGGHLALMAGYTPDSGIFVPPHYPQTHVRPAAVGSFFGPTDMTAFPEVDVYARNVVERYLGGTPAQIPDTYRRGSPVTYAGSAVPTIFEHGTADTTVPYAQSVELYHLLQQGGVETRLVSMTGLGHGLLLGRPGPTRDAEAAQLEAFLATVFAQPPLARHA